MNSCTKKEIKEMLIGLLQIKKDNTKEEKYLIKQVTETIRKKSLCLDLNKELKYHIEFNKLLLVYHNQASELKQDIKSSKSQLQIKCKELKEECKTLVNQMEIFDKIIIDLKVQREAELKMNNERIIILKKENNILNEKYKEITDKTNQQEKYLKEIEKNLKEYSGKIIKDKENFKCSDNDYKKKMKHFDKEIMNYKTFLYMSNIEDKEKTRASSLNKSKSIIIQEDLDIKLKDNQLMNDYLNSKLKKMSSQVIQVKADVAKIKARTRYNTPSIKKKMFGRINEKHEENDNNTNKTVKQMIEAQEKSLMNNPIKLKHTYASISVKKSSSQCLFEFHSN